MNVVVNLWIRLEDLNMALKVADKLEAILGKPCPMQTLHSILKACPSLLQQQIARDILKRLKDNNYPVTSII